MSLKRNPCCTNGLENGCSVIYGLFRSICAKISTEKPSNQSKVCVRLYLNKAVYMKFFKSTPVFVWDYKQEMIACHDISWPFEKIRFIPNHKRNDSIRSELRWIEHRSQPPLKDFVPNSAMFLWSVLHSKISLFHRSLIPYR